MDDNITTVGYAVEDLWKLLHIKVNVEKQRCCHWFSEKALINAESVIEWS